MDGESRDCGESQKPKEREEKNMKTGMEIGESREREVGTERKCLRRIMAKLATREREGKE